MEEIQFVVSQSCLMPWTPFSLSLNSSFSKESRIAVSSFEKSAENEIRVLRFVGPSIITESSYNVKFPVLKSIFTPHSSGADSDFLITCSDSVRLFQSSMDSLTNLSEIVISPNSDPVTSADWSLLEESLVIGSSADGSIASIDVSSSQVISRIIAHDHSVYDVAFVGASANFVSCSFDGSLRLFDLRNLDTSVILFQTSMPIQRIGVCPYNDNIISLFSKGSDILKFVDIRKPGLPVNTVSQKSVLTAVSWSRFFENHIYTTDRMGNLYLTEYLPDLKEQEATIKYSFSDTIESLTIGQGIVAITTNKSLNILKQHAKPKTNEHFLPIEFLLEQE